LCIIIDSMDRTKLVWPRWPFARTPKQIEGLHRPRLVLTGAMAHGWCTNVFLAHENQSHGADAFLEVLCQTLEDVHSTALTSGRRMPSHLFILSDNTVAQAKNEETCVFLAWLVSRYRFLTANIGFLMVGHTHEDIDQLFALIVKIVLKRRVYLNPAAFVTLLQNALEDRFLTKGECFKAKLLPTVRDFKAWLAPLGCSVEKCFQNRFGIETPHSFSFKMRQALTPTEVAQAAEEEDARTSRRRRGGRPDVSQQDVMACVKTYLRSPSLQQAPLAVLPEFARDRLLSASPATVHPVRPLSDEQIEHYLKLAAACDEELELPEAAVALRQLVLERVYPLPSDNWLRAAAPVRPSEAAASHPLFPHLPESSYRMVVRVRR
jgi:hypothetical protein